MNVVLKPYIFVSYYNEPFVFLIFPVSSSVNHDNTLHLTVT